MLSSTIPVALSKGYPHSGWLVTKQSTLRKVWWYLTQSPTPFQEGRTMVATLWRRSIIFLPIRKICPAAKDSGKFLNTPHSVGQGRGQECVADLSFSCLVTR